jgi:hypothetical protein
MDKRKRLTDDQELAIVSCFKELGRVAYLAKEYGMSRQAIYKVLKRHGVETPRVSIMAVSCSQCGAEMMRHRYRVRKFKHMFCTEDCYFDWLNRNNYKANRHGQRIGRKVVAQHFELKAGHVVHHVDGDNKNNGIENLMVFRNQGDHVRYHRGFDVAPIWAGK